jgi:2-C-methyl-D-erythritol 4-phosphate cytidylyltransferase
VSGVAAIVVAAGSGARFGSPKQFLPLDGVRLVDRAVAAASARCDSVVVVLPADMSWDGEAVSAVVTGGSTRAGSVRAGLDAIGAEFDVVVVHDAARPLARPELFDAVIAAVRAGADGAVPGVAVVDTLKRVESGRVVATVDRKGMVAVQTPQAFRREALVSAHRSGADAADDAALVEATGGTVVVVVGDAANLKITTTADLALALALIRRDQIQDGR